MFGQVVSLQQGPQSELRHGDTVDCATVTVGQAPEAFALIPDGHNASLVVLQMKSEADGRHRLTTQAPFPTCL